MKKILLYALLLFSLAPVSKAQIQVDKQLQFTGTNNDARITGIDSVGGNDRDAANVKSIQTGKLVYADATGSANAITVTLAPVPSAGYTAGMIVNFKAASANTGATTIDVNGLGAKTIKKAVTTDLAANDIKSGQLVSVMYDGTNFQMLSQSGNSGGSSLLDFVNGAKLFFVTSNKYSSNLGGLAGADAACQSSATNASLPGTFKAFLCTSTTNAISRVTPGYPYVNLKGDLLSTNSFLDASVNSNGGFSIYRAVLYDETGSLFATNGTNAYVWSGCGGNAKAYANTNCPQKGGTCSDWTYSGAANSCCCTPCNTGTYCSTTGYMNSNGTQWINGTGESDCSGTQRLYCFQQ